MILGMKVRKPDLSAMLKFNPKVLEFHFSDSDLNLELENKFDQKLIVHCFEYFERKLLDIASLGETNQVHSRERSIELIQKSIDKTILLNEQFSGKPTIIVHPGGYSLNPSTDSEIIKMKELVSKSVKELDLKNVNFLLENMPPYAWFFGGRWKSNVFLNAEDMKNYCNETDLKICYINKNGLEFVEGETIIASESQVEAVTLTLTEPSFDVTDSFDMALGQESTFYDYAKIIRKNTTEAPDRRLKIYFQSA